MAVHRYWRLLAEHNELGSNYGFGEIEMRESIGGADVTGSGTASDSSHLDAGSTAANCFDNNLTNKWISNGKTYPQWVKYDFGSGSEKDIAQIQVQPRPDTYYRETPNHFYFQYSDDDSAWTTSITIETTWTSDYRSQRFPATPQLSVFQNLSQVEYQEPALIKVSQLLAQIEYRDTSSRTNLDAVLQKTIYRNASLDAYLLDHYEKNVDLDALLQALKTKGSSLDAILTGGAVSGGGLFFCHG